MPWQGKKTISKNLLPAATGAASLNAKMNGMIALRTVSLFLVTSLISAIIGLVLVVLIHPGNTETKETLGVGQTEERKIDIVDNFLDLGRNLFPDNIFKASFMTVRLETTFTTHNTAPIWS